MPRSTRIGFIGGGNRVQGLAGGPIAAGWPAESLAIADQEPAQRERVTSPGGTTAAALAKLAAATSRGWSNARSRAPYAVRANSAAAEDRRR